MKLLRPILLEPVIVFLRSFGETNCKILETTEMQSSYLVSIPLSCSLASSGLCRSVSFRTLLTGSIHASLKIIMYTLLSMEVIVNV